MIRKVHFKNFRCLKDVELTLEPLTVLVGPNASGKTSVLEGLRLEQREPRLSDFWQQAVTHPPSVRWSYNDGGVHGYEAIANGTMRWQVSIDSLSPAVEREHNCQPLNLDPRALRQENVLQEENWLNESGSNLANVLYTLTRKQRGEIAEELCRLVPMLNDVDLKPTTPGHHRLRFQDRWAPDLWYTPEEVSDGTMLLLAFIILQYQNPPPDIITIEDPERALHPYLLEELIDMLRNMSTGKIGRKPVQVVLATHSAELLEYVRPEEVRFLTRKAEDGSVRVDVADTASSDWHHVFKEYRESLGSLWLSGGLRGVPGF